MAVNWSNRNGTAGPGRIEAGKETLGQDEGLSAACPGRQRNRDLAGGDGAFLLWGKSSHGGRHVFFKDRIWLMRQTVL